MIKKIKVFFIRLKLTLSRLFRKKSRKVFKVIRSNSRSMVGNYVVGVPKVGTTINAIDNNKKGYMTLEPISIQKRGKGETYIVYGRYNKIILKRIR